MSARRWTNGMRGEGAGAAAGARFAWRAACLLASVSACGGTAEPPPAGPPTSAAEAPKPAPPAATEAKVEAPAPSAIATPAAPEATAAPVASAAPEVTPAPPSEPDTGGCPAGMVRIKGGSFKLAAIKAQVTVKDYCLDVNLATTDQYAACVQSKKCNDNLLKVCEGSTYGVEGKGDLPIVCIDFPQAVDYCKAQGKRLPSGEEWEWAARGGPEAWTYPWGNQPPTDQLCWSGLTKRDGPCPIGSFKAGANPQGVLDLAGNVFQWTTTGNDVVSSARFGRGGSWKDSGNEVKAGFTFAFKTTYRCGFLGVRCAIPAPPP
ncbi:formylglycine-generating enzyme family protein [Polyangium spumosum]|nr:SUMF1/EgtB/PvdO family nonheme iron enzyme [Polyangium spumosum]